LEILENAHYCVIPRMNPTLMAGLNNCAYCGLKLHEGWENSIMQDNL